MNDIIKEFTEPITFYLCALDAVRASFQLPNGKTIILSQTSDYTTTDKEEQDFFSQQRHVGAKRMDDAKFRTWATLQFSKLPTIFNTLIKEPKDVEEFVWSSESEAEVIKHLKENGYIVYKDKKRAEKE